MKLSQWHDGTVKPVHIGVYNRMTEDDWFNYWNGKFWINGETTAYSASLNTGKSIFQNERWRGIVK